MKSKTLDSLAGWLAFISIPIAGLFAAACIIRLDALVYITTGVLGTIFLVLLLIAFTLFRREL